MHDLIDWHALGLDGDCPLFRRTLNAIAVAARSQASVLISGETGTGKEIAARAIHLLSRRADQPFVAVNIAALPETLVESELFGHERGAFTGAHAEHRGRFEQADGGTIFLDEIGELTPALQVKLLRVLQEREVQRLGGERPRRIDVRVVAATNRDLDVEVAEARFRSDLYYRLRVLTLPMPPLRDRRSDIPLLWEALTRRVRQEEGGPPLETSPRVLALLMRYRWPGNIRELENVARHVAAVAELDQIEEGHLPSPVRAESEVCARDAAQLAIPGMTLEEIERVAILATYHALHRSPLAAARALQVSVRTIHYRLRKYRAEGWLDERGPKSTTVESLDVGPCRPPMQPRLRLLLAEDDDDVRWSLGQLLQAQGFEVISVSSGTAMLEHLGAALLFEGRAVPPDIIVTDVRMPGLSGIQVLEGVRSSGWTIPVILITGYGDEATKAYAHSLNALVLDKPLDLVAFDRALGELVGLQHLQSTAQ